VEPVYRNIEFCCDPQTLWGKMREGRWDWLGVHRNGQFVLGSPRASRITDHAAVTLSVAEAADGAHGVRLEDDPERPASEFWFREASDADAKYDEIVAQYEGREGPLVVRVDRIEQREVVRTEWIVKRPSTYDWRPPPATQ
jgi:hypothetical protein